VETAKLATAAPIPSFFFFFFTLGPGAPSYIRRAADDELLSSLLRGDFCYVLNARQMGKSSLMVRVANELHRHDVRAAFIDLTAIGQNVTVEQWYYGLSANLCDQLELDGFSNFWNGKPEFSAHQRWSLTIKDFVLPRLKQPLVIFVDEIDLVRGLPFRADEFFAGIREAYNQRSTNPDFKKLTFCLLGVATPAELIDDPEMTPFNVGVRISLNDFSFEEALPLRTGINRVRDADSLLKRVLYWTDGHPYLTQRICRAIALDEKILSSADVDALCARMFFSLEGRDRDDNLLFIRSRLLDDSQDRATVLKTYGRILDGQSDLTLLRAPAIVAELVLTGIIKIENGQARVRNRLYAKVFNQKWVQDHLPDAEQRRIRRAFWNGAVKAGLASACVVALVAVSIFALGERATVRDRTFAADRLAFDSDVSLARQFLEANPPEREAALNALQSAKRIQNGMFVNFAWQYLWSRCNATGTPIFEFRPKHTSGFAAFTADGKAGVYYDGSELARWSLTGDYGSVQHRLRVPSGRALDISSDGNLLALADDHFLRVFDRNLVERSRSQIPVLTSARLSISPSKQFIAVSGMLESIQSEGIHCRVQIHDLQSNSLIYSAEDMARSTWAVFNSAGDKLAYIGSKGICIVDLTTKPKVSTLSALNDTWCCLVFGSPASVLYASNREGALYKIDVQTGQAQRLVIDHALSELDRIIPIDSVSLLALNSGQFIRIFLDRGRPQLQSFPTRWVHKESVKIIQNHLLALCDGDTSEINQVFSLSLTGSRDQLGNPYEGLPPTMGLDHVLMMPSQGVKAELESPATLRVLRAKNLRRIVSRDPFVFTEADKQGDKLLTLSSSGTAILWDVNTLHSLWSVNNVTFARLSPGGGSAYFSQLAKSSPGDIFEAPGNVVWIWRKDSGFKQIAAVPNALSEGFGEAQYLDENELLYAASDCTLHRYRVDSMSELGKTVLPGQPCRVFRVLPDNVTLVMPKLDGGLRLWSLPTGTWLVDLPLPHNAASGFITSIAYSAQLNLIAASTNKGALFMWCGDGTARTYQPNHH